MYVLEGLRKRASVQSGFWADINLRTNFKRIIKAGGFEPWTKLWHNLRASAQTDLAAHFPLHVACSWLGNSKAIASEHYLQVTDDDFSRAITLTDETAQMTTRAARADRI